MCVRERERAMNVRERSERAETKAYVVGPVGDPKHMRPRKHSGQWEVVRETERAECLRNVNGISTSIASTLVNNTGMFKPTYSCLKVCSFFL